jgi:hypothetical protein
MRLDGQKPYVPMLFRWYPAGALVNLLRNQQQPALKCAAVANLVLTSAAVGSLLVLAYFVYNYGWTGRRQFGDWSGVAVYYAGPALAALAFLLALRLSSKRKIDLTILVCASLLAVYGAEAYVNFLMRFSDDRQPIWGDQVLQRRAEVGLLAQKYGVEFDFRSKAQVLLDLRAAGVDAVPSIEILLKDHDDGSMRSVIDIDGREVVPLGGMSNRMTLFCNETGEYIVYRSDEHGFHNPAGLWASKRADIIALGDSFVQGACVPSDKNFVAGIRRRYPSTLNLGMAGMGPLTMLGVLKEALPAVNAKAVLWFYFEESDPLDIIAERKSELLLRYLESGFSQRLFARQPAVDAALADYAEKELAKELSTKRVVDFDKFVEENKDKLVSTMKLGSLRRRLGLVRGRKQDASPSGGSSEDRWLLEMPEKDLMLFRRVLSEANEAVAQSAGRLYFVYLPAWERYGRPADARRDRDRVLATVRSMNIPVIDIHSAFESHPDPLALFPFRRFGHYNEEGQRLVADTVLQNLSTPGALSGAAAAMAAISAAAPPRPRRPLSADPSTNHRAVDVHGGGIEN